MRDLCIGWGSVIDLDVDDVGVGFCKGEGYGGVEVVGCIGDEGGFVGEVEEFWDRYDEV